MQMHENTFHLYHLSNDQGNNAVWETKPLCLSFVAFDGSSTL